MFEIVIGALIFAAGVAVVYLVNNSEDEFRESE
jgi:hypothetical protein